MKTFKLLLLLVVGCFACSYLVAADGRGWIRIEVCRKKEQVVQLRPNPSYTGTLVVQSECKDPIHFYVFDVAGTMVYHALLLPGTRRSIKALDDGDYSYDVFKNDESVEQGKISVLQQKRKSKQRQAK